ncbi:MAG TPA: hypothetical protein VMV68_05970 [Spirochaetia bacterium]|nr:hypothetical protein [Spirochaetia bacterium]
MRIAYELFYKAVRAYFLRTSHIALPDEGEDAVIFIANHEQSFGPVTAMASLPKPVYPWVAHEITDRALCPGYIEEDFVRPEVRLRPPLSTLLARAIGRICVALMRDLKAIPVYKQSRRVADTIRISVQYIAQGRRLLIFPEIKGARWNEILCEFDTGFVGVARKLFEKTRRIAAFFPVAVNRRLRSLRLGAPVFFDPSRSYHAERDRIRDELKRRICALYREMEGEVGAPEEDRISLPQM